jgi:selT/selW/selH-like putative selenoprotein
VAAEVESALGTKVRLIEGSNGIFEVKADGRIVFSKARVGRFPNPGEVVAALRE